MLILRVLYKSTVLYPPPAHLQNVTFSTCLRDWNHLPSLYLSWRWLCCLDLTDQLVGSLYRSCALGVGLIIKPFRITAHTTMHFTVIVNPDSGPGASATPDSNYQACIPMLRPSANPNVKLVGYVSTNYANRALADVEADTNTYNNWPAPYNLDGIFFDEVNGTSDHLAAYTSYASHARSLTWHSTSFVSRLVCIDRDRLPHPRSC